MGKKVTLSEKAYAALHAAKRSEEESLSQVILRHVPPPIRTFGDLEKHLESLDGAVLDKIDWGYLKRLTDGTAGWNTEERAAKRHKRHKR